MSTGMNRLDFASLLEQLDKDGILNGELGSYEADRFNDFTL